MSDTQPALVSRRDRALERARRELARRDHTCFSSLFSYGAIDVDPRHLVVWVLLAGEPGTLPAWYFPRADHLDSARFATGLLAEIDDMHALVVDCFAWADWPNPELVKVGFDSEARVEAEGGWQYFK